MKAKENGADVGTWQNSTQLWTLLPLVENRISARKRRLFAVVCCRRFANLLADERSRRALEVAELHAEGLASEEERRLAEDSAVDVHILLRESRLSIEPVVPWSRQAELLTQAAVLAVSPGIYYAGDSADCLRLALLAGGRGLQVEQEEEIAQCRLLREIVGPLHPVSIDPRWLADNDHAVVQIARWIYDKHAFADLPILADALEDAGCGEERILAHCRESQRDQEHVRGCWVLDLLLAEP
jgi:hypothetical protein